MPLRLEGDEVILAGAQNLREALERTYAFCPRERLEWGQGISYTADKNIPLLRLHRYKEAYGLVLCARSFSAGEYARKTCLQSAIPA